MGKVSYERRPKCADYIVCKQSQSERERKRACNSRLDSLKPGSENQNCCECEKGPKYPPPGSPGKPQSGGPEEQDPIQQQKPSKPQALMDPLIGRGIWRVFHRKALSCPFQSGISIWIPQHSSVYTRRDPSDPRECMFFAGSGLVQMSPDEWILEESGNVVSS